MKEDKRMNSIARRINRASTDPTSEDSYTFLIVHAWSGMQNGKLVQHGNTMDAAAALIGMFGDQVEAKTRSASAPTSPATSTT